MIDLFFWTESKKQQQQKQRTGRPERGPRGAGADHRGGDQNALEPVETPWLPSKPESGQNWDAPAEWAADVPAEASGGTNWDQGAGAQ